MIQTSLGLALGLEGPPNATRDGIDAMTTYYLTEEVRSETGEGNLRRVHVSNDYDVTNSD